MKIFKNLSLVCMLAVLLLTTTACPSSSDNNEYRMEQSITKSMVTVIDIATGNHIQYSDVSYYMVYNYTTGKGEVQISGLKLPNGIDYPSIRLTDLTFTMDTAGWKYLEAKNVFGQVQGISSTPEFSNFKLAILDRMIKGAYYPAVDIAFTVNNQYKVIGSLEAQILMGSTVSTPTNGQAYADAAPVYVMEFDPKTQAAAVTINGAKFSQAMPAQNMTFKGLTYSVSPDGTVSLKASQPIIPEIGGTPFPAFPILGFTGSGTFGTRFQLQFQCNAMGQLYTITADLPYTYTGGSTPSTNQ